MKMGNQEQRFICGLKMAVVALTDLGCWAATVSRNVRRLDCHLLAHLKVSR
jgi:hypothetical protein